MDFLLRQEYQYNYFDKFDSTKLKIEKLLSNKLFDFSKNYYGNVNEDGSFTFKQKTTFFSLTNFGQDIYLNGQLINDNEKTIIKITLSPRFFLVIPIYLVTAFWIVSLFSKSTLFGNSNRLIDFVGIFLFDIAAIAIIQIRKYFVKKSFDSSIIKRLNLELKYK
jgi:hypothetical protein